MKKIILIFFSFLLTILILAFFILYIRGFKIPSKTFNDKMFKPEYSLKWTPSLNKKQSFNSCASYSTMAFLYVVSDTIFDPEFINSTITGKMRNNYTYPWGVTSFLKKQGISSNIFWFGVFNSSVRVNWIKQRIVKGDPVILIVGNRKYLHYITVLGYSDTFFFVYDPNLNGDKNGDQVGNITMPVEDVITWWNSAFFKILRLNLAISRE
jgi:hypothetical protein